MHYMFVYIKMKYLLIMENVNLNIRGR
jgi:hypothetical protein